MVVFECLQWITKYSDDTKLSHMDMILNSWPYDLAIHFTILRNQSILYQIRCQKSNSQIDINFVQVRLTVPVGKYQIGFELYTFAPGYILGTIYDVSVKNGVCLEMCMYA